MDQDDSSLQDMLNVFMAKRALPPRLTGKRYAATLIAHELGGKFDMATITISPKFQIVISKDVREKLHLSPH